jgi:HSP20 family protein
VDLAETEEALVVVVELAGLKKEDLSIWVAEGALRIAGRRREFLAPVVRRLNHVEIERGPFERCIPLPKGFSAADVRAELKDGLLIVNLYKQPDEKRTVEIKEEDS